MKKSIIESKDISVVVQGNIDESEIKKCLNSIRKYLPQSEIILSTYKNSELKGLDFDVLVEVDDPGTFNFINGKNVYNNLNRQLLTTQKGLEKADRKYILKIRSDLIMQSSDFLKYFDKYQTRCDEFKLFERKIIIPTLYTRKFLFDIDRNKFFTPFHPADCFLFGLNQDIKKYFMDTSMVEEPGFSTYFKTHENTYKMFDNALYRFPPEQYLALSCFKKYFSDIKMENMNDFNEENILQSEKVIVNNFIVLEYKQHKMFLNKYRYTKNEKMIGELEYLGIYNKKMYLMDYVKYCDNGFKLPFAIRLYENIGIEEVLTKINKHIYRFNDKNLPLSKRLEQIMSISVNSFYLMLKIIFRFPAALKNSKLF